MAKGASSFRDWGELVLHMIHSAGIQTNRDYHAEGWLGISFTIITSMAGLVFAGVWIAIFMSDFAIIFGKDIQDRKLRLMLASGQHRTIRLRRTRRKDM